MIVHLGCVYRSSGSSLEEDIHFFQALTEAITVPAEVLTVGDFTLQQIKWNVKCVHRGLERNLLGSFMKILCTDT